MDDLDRRLIALLRHDARLPVASLAADLGVSRATVKARIDRLTETGVIQGFTVRLRSHEAGGRVRAIMMIEVEGHRAESVVRRLQGFPEVRACTRPTAAGMWSRNWKPTRWRRSIGCSPPSACSTASPVPKPASCCRHAKGDPTSNANGPPRAGRRISQGDR